MHPSQKEKADEIEVGVGAGGAAVANYEHSSTEFDWRKRTAIRQNNSGNRAHDQPGGRSIKELPEWAEFTLSGESRVLEGETWWQVSIIAGAEGAGWLSESVVEMAMEGSTIEIRRYPDETCMSSPIEAKWLRGFDLLRRYQHALLFPAEVELMEVRPATLIFNGEIADFEAGVDVDLNAVLLPATWVGRQSIRFRGPNWDEEHLWQLHWVCDLVSAG